MILIEPKIWQFSQQFVGFSFSINGAFCHFGKEGDNRIGEKMEEVANFSAKF